MRTTEFVQLWKKLYIFCPNIIVNEFLNEIRSQGECTKNVQLFSLAIQLFSLAIQLFNGCTAF